MNKYETIEGLLAGERCGEKHTDSFASKRGMRFAEGTKRYKGIAKKKFNMHIGTSEFHHNGYGYMLWLIKPLMLIEKQNLI